MSNASPLHRFFELPRLLPPPNTEAARRDLEAALGLLHKEGLVFGGLRTLNILYSVKDERAFLGVRKWQIMERSYDLANLGQVVEWIS